MKYILKNVRKYRYVNGETLPSGKTKFQTTIYYSGSKSIMSGISFQNWSHERKRAYKFDTKKQAEKYLKTVSRLSPKCWSGWKKCAKNQEANNMYEIVEVKG